MRAAHFRVTQIQNGAQMNGAPQPATQLSGDKLAGCPMMFAHLPKPNATSMGTVKMRAVNAEASARADIDQKKLNLTNI